MRLLRRLFPAILICPVCCDAAPNPVDDMCPRCRKYYVAAPWLLQVKLYVATIVVAFLMGAAVAFVVISEADHGR